MQITLTFEVSQEQLNAILALAGNGATKTEAKAPKTKAVAPPPEEVEETEEDLLGGNGVEKAAPLTLETIREKATAIIQSGKQAAVKAALKKFGAANLGALDKKKYEAFYKEIGAI